MENMEITNNTIKLLRKLMGVEVDISNVEPTTTLDTILLNIINKPNGGGLSDLSNYYTKTEINALLNNVSLADYYTKSEIDALLSNKIDGLNYEVNEINTKLSDVVYQSTIQDYYTKAEVDGKLNNSSSNTWTFIEQHNGTEAEYKREYLVRNLEDSKEIMLSIKVSITGTCYCGDIVIPLISLRALSQNRTPNEQTMYTLLLGDYVANIQYTSDDRIKVINIKNTTTDTYTTNYVYNIYVR